MALSTLKKKQGLVVCHRCNTNPKFATVKFIIVLVILGAPFSSYQHSLTVSIDSPTMTIMRVCEDQVILHGDQFLNSHGHNLMPIILRA